jgi:hypothetical protein
MYDHASRRLAPLRLSRWHWRIVSMGAAVLCLTILAGCLGLGVQLGPLGIHLGACDAPEPPKPPSPRPHPEATATVDPNGTLRQDGEISIPPRCCASVYYLRPYTVTPHLEVSEPDTEDVNFLVTEQASDHFTVRNKCLLCARTFVWRARGAGPVPPPVEAGPPPGN